MSKPKGTLSKKVIEKLEAYFSKQDDNVKQRSKKSK